MDGSVIPLIHRWGAGIRPARRRAGGLKGVSISGCNGKDGAITLAERRCSCLVCCFVYVTQIINIVSVSLIFSCLWPYRSWTICLYVLHRILISASCAIKPQQRFKMCISSCMVFISNLLFQFTYFENIPWLMGGLFCLFVYRRMKYSYCSLFRAEVI